MKNIFLQEASRMQKKKGKKDMSLEEAIILQEEEQLEKEIKQGLKKRLDEELGEEYLTDEESHLHTLFNAISSNEGHYAKVYRLDPIPENAHGHPLFLYDIRRPEVIKDLERELQSLAIKYGWCDGLYEVRVLKTGVGKPLRVAEIALAVPHEVEKNPFQTSPSGQHTLLTPPSQSLEGVADMMKAMKDLAPEVKEDKTNELLQNLLTNMMEMQKREKEKEEKSTNELLKALIEAGRPTPPPQYNIAGILTAIAPILQEFLKPKEFKSDLASLIEAKQAGVFPEPRRSDNPSTLTLLKELRESGLITPPAPPQDATKSLGQIAELIGVMTPFMEKMGGGGGNATVGVELVRALVPQLGKIVGDVTGTINNAISAKTAMIAKGKKAPKQIEQTSPEVQQPQTSPEILAIAEAVKRKDVNFFPTLENNITTSFGDAGYESILSGEVPISTIVDQLKPFHEVFKKPEAEEYFNTFLLWAKKRKASEFAIKCEKCGEEYIFDSEAEFKSEVQNCEICNTVLGKVAASPEVEGEKETTSDVGDVDEKLLSN